MPSDHKLTISPIPPIVVKADEAITPEKTREKIFDYFLKVEEHADKFFEMRHKIAFFLITAAAGSVAYTLNFSIGRLTEVATFPERKVCLIIAALFAILTVISSLLSMYYDVEVNRLNLGAYFDKQLYTELPVKEQEFWTKAGKKEKDHEVLAFTFLGVSIAYQATLFVLFII
jgi:hypothetical protein